MRDRILCALEDAHANSAITVSQHPEFMTSGQCLMSAAAYADVCSLYVYI